MRCYRSALRARGEGFEVLESRQLLSVTPQLLADINPEQSSYPRDFIEFDGKLFYTAEHAEYGRELWSSDGTPEGTGLVKDIRPGEDDSKISGLTVSGGWLYFVADDGTHGRELWRTDGTAEGTELFHEFSPGGNGLGTDPDMADVAGTLFLETSNPANLWKSDGTEAGTVLLKSISNSAENFTAVGDLLFFTGARDELWKSDGTPEGTTLVKDFNTGIGHGGWVEELTAFDGNLFFVVDGFVWKSNGTAAGTVKVASAGAYQLSYAESLEVAGDKLFFAARRDNQDDIWVINGESSPAVPVQIPTNLSIYERDQLTAVGNSVYYRDGLGGSHGLWRTDGTTEGTNFVVALEEDGQPLYIDQMTAFGDELFFATSMNNSIDGPDLWRANGTPEGTSRWRTFIVAPMFYFSIRGLGIELGVAGGNLYFTANGGGTGLELWRTDGTDEGTLQLHDLPNVATDSSTPRDFVSTTTHVYFTADNGFGRQLFSAAGPNGPVTQLTPSMSGLVGSQVEQLTPVGSLLYFVAVDENGRYLGVSDGTLAGTQRLSWPFAMGEVEVYGLNEFGGGVIFLIADETLGVMIARADSEGIEIVHTLGTTFTVSDVDAPVIWQGHYYFIAGEGTKEIWHTDGTSAGTQRLSDTAPNLGPYGQGLTATTNLLYFISAESDESPSRLWRTDGTAEGSFAYSDLQVPLQLKALGNYLFFSFRGHFNPYDNELWSTDGTIEGTILVGEYNEPHAMSWLSGMQLIAAELNGLLYFFGPAATVGSEFALWRSDGTVGGTEHVVDFPDIGSSRNWLISSEGGRLLLYVNSYIYESDGTATGTRKLPVSPYLSVEFGRQVAWLNDTLYYGLSTAEYGWEPFTYTRGPSSVAGRHLFYNESVFDGNGSTVDWQADGRAIDTNKQAYLPGSGPATFANISSYSRGINGILIDILDLPDNVLGPLITLDDFAFRVGNTNDPNSWADGPAPNQIGFVEYTDLGWGIFLSWESGAIKNTWLEVTVLANERTGLAEPDVFYFGSRIGDTGSGTPAAAVTSAADELAARFALGVNQSIVSLVDFDRNGVVNAGDALIARNNAGILLKLDLPGENSPAAVPLVLAEPLRTSAAAKSPSRGELLAYAMQNWREWLDADDEDEFFGGR